MASDSATRVKAMRNTYERIFFLGAGASAAVGLPVTSEILPRVLTHLSDGSLFGQKGEGARNAKKRRDLRRCLESVFPMVLKGDPPPVTDLFSLIDHMVVTQQAPTANGSVDDLRQVRRLLEQATLWVLANPKRSGTKTVRAEARRFYGQIVRGGRRGVRRSCFITTNYDREIEAAVLPTVGKHVERDIDFGLTWRHHSRGALVDRPLAPAVGIYKLHGSTTWLACPCCGHVYIRPNMSVWTVGYWDVRHRFNTCHCNNVILKSVVVAPSLVRSVAEPCLTSVWQASVEALQSADEWVFIGYSLPNEDIAIRSLLLRGYHGRMGRQPNVLVVQRSPDPVLESRYRFLFPDCSVDVCGFEAYMQRSGVA